MRKLTVTEIINRVKKLAHDTTLSTDLIYDLINQALHDIEAEADYNFQVIKNEQVTVPANTTLIQTAYPIKRIISVFPVTTRLEIKNGELHLTSAPDKDIVLTLDYIRAIPEFNADEQNNIFPDSDLLILGAVYYALLYNMQPEFAKYEQIFYKRLKQFAEKNSFILPMPKVENLQNIAI